MKRVQTISYRGKEIILTDLGQLEGAEIMAPLLDAAKVIRSHPEHSVLTLTDVSEVRFNLRSESGEYDRVLAESIRSCIAGNKPHVKAAAIVVGDDENKRVLVEFFNRTGSRQFTIFDTLDEACEWLVSQ